MLSFTIPTLIDPSRRSALAIVIHMDRYPNFIWWTIGVLVVILAMYLSNMTGEYIGFITKLQNAFSMMMMFVAPGILLIFNMKDASKANWIGILSFIILGIGFAAFTFL